jgi:hypothetical protein
MDVSFPYSALDSLRYGILHEPQPLRRFMGGRSTEYNLMVRIAAACFRDYITGRWVMSSAAQTYFILK